MSSLKIIHQRQECIGCNSCVNIAPQTWFMDEKEGKAKLVGAVKKGKLFVAEFFGCNEVFECDYELNQAAADACPMHIIKVQRNG